MKKQATILVVSLGLLLSSLIGQAKTRAQIVMMDVGQGDAIYIRTPAGQDILIDAGRSYQAAQKLVDFMPRGDDTIEMVIASHMDADHIGGLKNVLEKYKVSQVFYNAEPKQTATAKNFLATISAHKVPLREMYQGQRIKADNFTMDILWPPRRGTISREKIEKKSNNFSIVSSVSINNKKILLTADLPSEIEQELLREHQIGQADILQIPHHGSRFSSSLNLLKIASPDKFWISVGKNNRYGHPAQEVIDRLKKLSGTIKRTDQDGSLRMALSPT